MSRTFELNKLVRDGVVDDMLRLGQQVVYRELEGQERIVEHNNKIREEAVEVGDDSAEILDELADVMEATEARAKLAGINFETLRAHQLVRREKRGSFDKHVFVERVSVEDGDEWADYYAKDPIKYKEI